MADQHKITLDESEMPTRWYNVIPDLPSPPPPPLHPGTLQPVGPDDLAPLFPMDLILQEVTAESYVDIPDEVLDVYRQWRPSPLYRAHRLEKALGHAGADLLQVRGRLAGRLAQAEHRGAAGVLQRPGRGPDADDRDRRRPVGHGAGLSRARSSASSARCGRSARRYDQKPYRRMMMETSAPRCTDRRRRSPRPVARILAETPNHPGSLGIAISEAVEVAAQSPRPEVRPRESVLNHVLLHQTIIGEEALLQFAKVGETPDVLVGCTGGGSNFGGLSFPFLREKLAGRMNPVIRAVEPASCPSLTRGVYAYDFGDTAGMTPLLKMHTLGHDFIPDPIHAGGLRYHGMSPLISHIYELGLMEAIAIPQTECFAAGVQFARTEGIVPAPEPTHALAACVREALACKESGEEKVILTALCGHGHFDLAAYEAYLAGTMVDEDVTDARFAAALETIPALA